MDLEPLEDFVKKRCKLDKAAHDWWHIQRVRKTARKLAAEEGCNLETVELIALLHDAWDWKLGSARAARQEAIRLMRKIGLDQDLIRLVVTSIDQLGFKGALAKQHRLSREAAVVQDSDRLDAIGAIGIARAFSYGGRMNRQIHDPAKEPVLHRSFSEYRRSRSTTINHFYEKLLLLKDRMNTESAKRIAEARHSFMLRFLEEFEKEWKGEA